MWMVAKNFLGEKTKKNVKIDTGTSSLLEIADADQIPSFLGGTCTCGGKGCLYSDFGPWHEHPYKCEYLEVPDFTNSTMVNVSSKSDNSYSLIDSHGNFSLSSSEPSSESLKNLHSQRVNHPFLINATPSQSLTTGSRSEPMSPREIGVEQKKMYSSRQNYTT